MNFVDIAKSLPEDVREKLFARLDEIQLSSSVPPTETKAQVEAIVNDLRLDFAFDSDKQNIANMLSMIPDAVVDELFQDRA